MDGKRSRIHFALFLITVGIVSSLFLATGCTPGEESQDPQKDIIGTWETNDGSLRLEFQADGTLVVHQSKGGVTIDTESETVFVDETHLLGVWDRALQIYEVHVYPKRLILNREDGEDITLTRVE